jgi:hypothetical protein
VVTVETGTSVADQQVYITRPKSPDIDVCYIAGILGSRLAAFLVHALFDETSGTFPQIKISQLASLPMPSFSDLEDRGAGARLAALVKEMFPLNKQIGAATTDHEKAVLQRQIDATDRKIDEIVYELYGLTDEEIQIVEEAAK